MTEQKKGSPLWMLDTGTRMMIAGGGAGAITKTAVAPFERIKILCQVGESRGLVETFTAVVKSEGVLGLWRGNFANVVRIIPNKGVLFMCSDAYKGLLRSPGEKTLSPWKSVVSGSLSGATAVLATYPLDLVRGRVAGKLGESKYRGILSTIRLTLKHEGFFALYRGVGPTLAGSFPYEGIKFGVYDTLKIYAKDEAGQVSQMGKLVCGAMAGTTASIVMFPNDTIRRIMQMQGIDGKLRYKNSWDCYRQVVATRGIAGLYRGMAANLVRVAPNNALMFGSWEFLKALLLPEMKGTATPAKE